MATHIHTVSHISGIIEVDESRDDGGKAEALCNEQQEEGLFEPVGLGLAGWVLLGGQFGG